MTYSGGCHCGRVAFEVDGEIERVVERHPSYLVVEKEDPEAEQVARETDPRP